LEVFIVDPDDPVYKRSIGIPESFIAPSMNTRSRSSATPALYP